jgi:hypothetical protein
VGDIDPNDYEIEVAGVRYPAIASLQAPVRPHESAHQIMSTPSTKSEIPMMGKSNVIESAGR